METRTFMRKSFEVEAVQVTEENMNDVAQWCQGRVVNATNDEGKHVKVRVMRVMEERQTKAFVGDWVLYAGTGYKVYNAKAFQKSFDPLDGTAKDAANQAAKTQPVEELRTINESAETVKP